MRRSYEFKEESYIMHEKGSWDYPSYEKDHEVSSPIIHKMLHKPSFQHSTLSPYGHHDEDDMVLNRARWDDTPGWCGTHHHLTSGNLTVKKNEHQASRVNYDRHGESHGWGGTGTQAMKKNKHQESMGTKSILRPPLGSVNPPSRHQHHQYTMCEGSGQAGVDHNGRPYFHGEGSTRESMSMMVNHSNSNPNWMEASKRYEDYYNHGSSKNSNWMEASKRFGDYDAQLQEKKLEHLMKGLSESGLSGEVVHKIEVIEYETRRYGGGMIRAYPQTHSIYND